MPPNPDQKTLDEMMRLHEQKTLFAERFNPQQRRLLPNLVRALGSRLRPVTLTDLEKLQISMQVANEPLPDAVGKETPEYQSVKVMMFLVGLSQSDDYLEFFLPLQFSEKWWGKMSIESE